MDTCKDWNGLSLVMTTYHSCHHSERDVVHLGVVEGLRVRYVDSRVRRPVAHRSQFLLLQLEQVQLEIGATSLAELNVAGEAVHADRVNKVVQGQTVVPRVLQLAGQIPWPQDVAGLGGHQTGSERVHGIKDEGRFRLKRSTDSISVSQFGGGNGVLFVWPSIYRSPGRNHGKEFELDG